MIQNKNHRKHRKKETGFSKDTVENADPHKQNKINKIKLNKIMTTQE